MKKLRNNKSVRPAVVHNNVDDVGIADRFLNNYEDVYNEFNDFNNKNFF